jgi:hypothetical protein
VAELSAALDRPEPLVEWLERSLNDIAGRDPLGLNTITVDRILPQLLPGILQLSERARYFSIYAWMLWQFAERRRPVTTDELDRFITRREYELCLAIKLCPHCDGDSAIGTLSARPAITAGEDPLQRGRSVDSSKGGFGLYYRSPLVELGAVAPVGTPLGNDGTPTPVEVLRRDPRALSLAESFHEAIEGTAYFQQFERTSDPIPRKVMEDLAARVCLCRLGQSEAERDAIRELIFSPVSADPAVVAASDARRRAFALLLSLLTEEPQIAYEIGAFWRTLISRFESSPAATDLFSATLAPWAALAMKECIQETLCSIWTDFCRSGADQQPPVHGMDREQLRSMIGRLADGSGLALNAVSFEFLPDESAGPVQRRLCDAAREHDWNAVRAWTVAQDTAASGIAALLILAARVPDPRRVHPHWGEIARRGSEHQDGLLSIVALLRRELAGEPTMQELMGWLIRRFIIGPHRAIAYSKLPEATFRFDWEETGRLRFFRPGGGGHDRFRPSDDRRGVMATLSQDLGYWEDETTDQPQLTTDGRELIAEAFR